MGALLSTTLDVTTQACISFRNALEVNIQHAVTHAVNGALQHVFQASPQVLGLFCWLLILLTMFVINQVTFQSILLTVCAGVLTFIAYAIATIQPHSPVLQCYSLPVWYPVPANDTQFPIHVDPGIPGFSLLNAKSINVVFSDSPLGHLPHYHLDSVSSSGTGIYGLEIVASGPNQLLVRSWLHGSAYSYHRAAPLKHFTVHIYF